MENQELLIGNYRLCKNCKKSLLLEEFPSQRYIRKDKSVNIIYESTCRNCKNKIRREVGRNDDLGTDRIDTLQFTKE